jgi:SAM-dependent methyltransferase
VQGQVQVARRTTGSHATDERHANGSDRTEGSMSDDVSFDEEEARGVEALYRTDAAGRRRERVREALAPEPGESVLSVGVGPGFEPAGLARAVGESGAVHGVDVSEAMLALARERCADHPQVTLEQGDATDLPVADEAFDAATSVQVYEYVEDVPAAADELHRVLQPGGRAVVYATDWDSLVWHAADRDRSLRMAAAWDRHCTHPHLGSRLRPTLREAGFEVAGVEPFTVVETSLEGTFAGYMHRMIRSYVANHDAFDEATANAWADDVQAREDADETFFSLTAYLYRVEKQAND